MTAGSPPPRPSTARLSAPPLSAMRARARPRTVVVAVWLWVVAAGLAIGAALLAVARLDGLHAGFVLEARASDPAATQDMVSRVAGLSSLIVVGGGLLIGVAGLLFAAVLRAGRGWARPALVLVAVAVVGYAVLVLSTSALVLACAAVAVAAAVCMYLPGSRTWFV